jgi:hypothetical protein
MQSDVDRQVMFPVDKTSEGSPPDAGPIPPAGAWTGAACQSSEVAVAVAALAVVLAAAPTNAAAKSEAAKGTSRCRS